MNEEEEKAKKFAELNPPQMQGHWGEAPAPFTDGAMYHAISERDSKRLEIDFTYHAPKPGQPAKYEALRDFGKRFAIEILTVCPESRERSLAITKLEEAVFWANAAIARNE